MQRRQYLALIGGATTSQSGCLGAQQGSTPNKFSGTGTPPPTTSNETLTVPTDEVTISSPTGACGAAAELQSAQFVDDGGGDPPACYEGAKPSLAIENERNEQLTVAVEIASEDGPIFEESYTLSPGERTVEQRALTAHEKHTASVVVDGEEPVSGEWAEISCYRHGISVTAEDVEFGLVPPHSGPGDVQHDCFAGDSAHIRVNNADGANIVTIFVVDHCEEAVHERTLSLGLGAVEIIDDLIVNGGMYDVIVAVDGGQAGVYEFRDECWGVAAGIGEDGSVTIHHTPID